MKRQHRQLAPRRMAWLLGLTAAIGISVTMTWADHKPNHNPPGGNNGGGEPFVTVPVYVTIEESNEALDVLWGQEAEPGKTLRGLIGNADGRIFVNYNTAIPPEFATVNMDNLESTADPDTITGNWANCFPEDGELGQFLYGGTFGINPDGTALSKAIPRGLSNDGTKRRGYGLGIVGGGWFKETAEGDVSITNPYTELNDEEFAYTDIETWRLTTDKSKKGGGGCEAEGDFRRDPATGEVRLDWVVRVRIQRMDREP